MAELTLTAALSEYDRTNPLRTGDIRPDGIDLRVLALPTAEIFYRMCHYQEFDASEMSMSAHTYLLGRGEGPFVGMPAFLSRAFRQNAIYVNADAGIEKPEDLNGKRIGIFQWGITGSVWLLGTLAEEYGLDFTSVEWVAETESRVPMKLPKGVRLRFTEKGQNVSDMLERGEVDAALYLRVPESFTRNPSRVRRLFPDYKKVEIDYYRRTGIHPMMHCVVLRRDIYERAPWALKSLYKALCEAKRHAYRLVADTARLTTVLPLLPAAVDEVHQIFGDDYWPYGMERNRAALEKFLLYAHQQGVTPRKLAVEELFSETVQDETFI